MMGIKPRIFTPIDAVTLDQLVPADHFYRHLDRTLESRLHHEQAGSSGDPER